MTLVTLHCPRGMAAVAFLDGGGEGHADLLRVIGEEAGSRGLDLPGPGGGLGVEVSRLTCQSRTHKKKQKKNQDITPVNQKAVNIHLKPAAIVIHPDNQGNLILGLDTLDL